MTSTPITPPPKVLIVGGGPSGLVLALGLLHNGVPIRIIEKNSLPRLGQRGAGIMPRSLELFTSLGIIEQVMEQAILTPPVRMYKMPEGVEVVHEFEMCPRRTPTSSHPYLHPVMLGQDKLEKIFHNALAEFGCSVELGTELKSFVQTDGCVKATLVKRGFSQDMESGEIEEATFDYMIGADGARGVVRNQLGLSFLGETRNVENFIVGDIRVDGLAQTHWHMWGDASDVLISLRATETPKLFNFVIGGRNVNHSKIARNEEDIKKCFYENTGRRSDITFLDMPWMSQYTPNIRMVDRFGYGRVYVTGDAGHVHSPNGGQGMNTGIQDSFNLGWKLALVVKGISPPSLLDTFSKERIPVIAEMIEQTTKLLKNTLDNVEPAVPTSSSLFQLGVNYRWSTIVLDELKKIELDREAIEDAYIGQFELPGDDDDDGNDDADNFDSYGETHDGHLRAGDRAPDASGLTIVSPRELAKQTCQLFQIFGPAHHTVLIFADVVNAGDVLTALLRYPKELICTVVIAPSRRSLPKRVDGANFVLEDWNGNAASAYCPSSICGICIIRPDGFVGALVKGQTWMHQYFRGIFATSS